MPTTQQCEMRRWSNLIAAGYWDYLVPELEHLEKKWCAKQFLVADAEVASAAGPKCKETR